jgi:5-methylcytosine-specific restriction protein B
MSDFMPIQEQYELWDEFLKVWPIARLSKMTLDEYIKAGSKDSFTYWIESRLSKLGRIYGGSAFKFGVFSRKDTEDKKSGRGLSYSDTHGWYSSLGTTAEEAFEKVRGYVGRVAKLAEKGKVDDIEAFKYLSPMFKWKIAFHYQNRQQPVIVNIFTPEPLAAHTGGTAKQSMAVLQKAALAKRPAGVGILEYGWPVWNKWEQKKKLAKPVDGPIADGPKPPDALKPIASCTNRIYYGPPGTGKTYTLQLLKRDYEQQRELVSTEEWRNQIIAEKIAVLKWWEGAAAALYDLGGKAKVADIVNHRFIQAIMTTNSSNQNVRQTLWRTLQSHTVDESATVKTKERLSPAVFDKTSDSVWQFAGDWQDDCVDLIALVDQLKRGQQDADAVQRYSFVTFHQSYGYEEFVEGLRPVLAGETEAGEVAYEIRPGAFKELCRKARQAPGQRFAMLIDEINRGNISKIFGELITLIEPDKRDPLDGSAPPEVVLAYSGEKFSVPANVDIIGTMNTADRSLALLDTALRRRFKFVALLPDTRAEKDPDDPNSAPLAGLVVTTDAAGSTIDVRQLLERINERIEALYDRDHCIGHAYLTGLIQVEDGQQRFEALTDVFRRRIVPLLEEYFFEDWQKIRLVLGDNQKDVANQFVRESDAHEQDLATLFGNNHGLDSYATKRRYSLQESAFTDPAAYIGIYQASA